MSAAVALPYIQPPLVLEAVALSFSTNIDALRGRAKDNTLRLARAAAVLLLREYTALSFPEISKLFMRERSFAAANLRSAHQLIEEDPRFEQTVDQARQRLLQGLHV